MSANGRILPDLSYPGAHRDLTLRSYSHDFKFLYVARTCFRGLYTWLVHRTLAAPAARVLLNFSCVIDPKSCNLLIFSLAKGVKRIFFAQGPGLYKDLGPARAHKEGLWLAACLPRPALPANGAHVCQMGLTSAFKSHTINHSPTRLSLRIFEPQTPSPPF